MKKKYEQPFTESIELNEKYGLLENESYDGEVDWGMAKENSIDLDEDESNDLLGNQKVKDLWSEED